MKLFPIIAFWILSIVTLINTYLLYFINGIIWAPKSLLIKSQIIITFAVLIAILLSTTLAYLSSARFIKKNLLRLSILLSLALNIVSIVSRFIETLPVEYTIWRWAHTVLYLLYTFGLLLIAHDLFQKLVEMSEDDKDMEALQQLNKQ